MTDTADGAAATAGILAPPPLLYLGAFFAGSLAEALWPTASWAMTGWLRGAGLVLFIASAAFARWAFVTLRRMGTSASPRQASAALGTDGPFGWSRNPIYVAMTGLYLGLTGLLASPWPLLPLAPLLAAMHWGVIRREEVYLHARFGAAYVDYRRRVRRYL